MGWNPIAFDGVTLFDLATGPGHPVSLPRKRDPLTLAGEPRNNLTTAVEKTVIAHSVCWNTIPRAPDSALAACTQQRHAAVHELLDRGVGLVREFAAILTQRCGQELTEWIAKARADALPGFDSYLNGLVKDWDVTVTSLTLPYSNGPIEGVNTKSSNRSTWCQLVCVR